MIKPIDLQNISLSFSHKTCFEDFNIQIPHGNRIAIIGRNGSGKSSLIKMLHGSLEPTSGNVKIDVNMTIGYIPQIIDGFEHNSGGERFNAALTEALSLDPDLLLMDEPTNHLDRRNRKSLMRMLSTYQGTLIVVSHDTEFLRNCIDTLWHIDQGKIHVFSGNYDDYMNEIRIKRLALENEYAKLDRQKKDTHNALMREQDRAAKSRSKGAKSIDQRKWPTMVSDAKAGRAEETSGRKKSEISNKKQRLSDRLSHLHVPEIILPKFSLTASELGTGALVSISNGCVGYEDRIILKDINISVMTGGHLAIIGDNGSGKSTLIKAIFNKADVTKSGNWYVPKPKDIGYLDQHYNTLDSDKSVLETIEELRPEWTHAEVRRHLNDFLFRKNEEVSALIMRLSGREKVRLSLAMIAAKTPKLLILDEITNNLDLETRQHVIEILKNYPGGMIVISHDEDFLSKIGVNDRYEIK